LLRRYGWITSAILIMLSLCIVLPAYGDVLPPEPAETQGIGVSTNLVASGMLSQRVELQWGISSEVLGANLVYRGEEEPVPVIEPEPPLNPGGEVQSHVVYSENTQAVMGRIDYRKESSLDTSVQLGPNPNVENVRQITFVADDVGRLYSTEDMSMFNVGNSIRTDDGAAAICPFLPGIYECIPMFCNRFEAGSVIDMSVVSASTSAGIRNINPAGDPGYWTPVPVIDDPARADYRIRVAELETSPSIGLVSAYSRIHSIEGGTTCPGQPIAAQQITFEEERTAIGDVSLFQYLVSYESGVIR
jgi:hypothetical protein